MKKVLLILITAFAFAACTVDADKQENTLDVSAFEEKLANTPDKILLDVRTPSEYRRGHLREAVLIDVQGPDFAGQVQKLDKSKPLFVYCASGIRSEKAVKILQELGFREIYEMEEGFNAWAEAGKSFDKD